MTDVISNPNHPISKMFSGSWLDHWWLHRFLRGGCWFWHPKSLAERSGAFDHLGGLFGQILGKVWSQRSVTAVSFPTLVHSSHPNGPIGVWLCHHGNLQLSVPPNAWRSEVLLHRFTLTTSHGQSLSQPWPSLASQFLLCLSQFLPVLYCWESVYPNISPYSIHIITLCIPSCVKSDGSYLGPPDSPRTMATWNLWAAEFWEAAPWRIVLKSFQLNLLFLLPNKMYLIYILYIHR